MIKDVIKYQSKLINMSTDMSIAKIMVDVDKVIEQFKSKWTLGDISMDNIVPAVASIMSIVGEYKELSGRNKKFATFQIIKSMLPEDDQLDMLLNNVIPTLIDNLIDVEKGKIVFNKKVKSGFFGCLKFLSTK